MQNDPKPIACTDECGNEEWKPIDMGWTLLPISGRWRCPSCTRVLKLVNQNSREAELLQKPEAS